MHSMAPCPFRCIPGITYTAKVGFRERTRRLLQTGTCCVQAQKHAIRQLNVLKYRKSDLNLSVLEGFTEDNLHTRIGANTPL